MENDPELITTHILRQEMLHQLRLRGFTIRYPEDLEFAELAQIFWMLRSPSGVAEDQPETLAPLPRE